MTAGSLLLSPPMTPWRRQKPPTGERSGALIRLRGYATNMLLVERADSKSITARRFSE